MNTLVYDTYQAGRLQTLTQQFAESNKAEVTIAASMRIAIAEVMANPAYCGIYRKFLKSAAEAEEDFKRSELLTRSHEIT